MMCILFGGHVIKSNFVGLLQTKAPISIMISSGPAVVVVTKQHSRLTSKEKCRSGDLFFVRVCVPKGRNLTISHES